MDDGEQVSGGAAPPSGPVPTGDREGAPGDVLTAALAEGLRGDRDRVSAVRRVEAAAVGSRALERLAHLAARLLDAGSAQVSLLGDLQTVAGGAGLAPDSVGGQGPLADSLCTVTAGGQGPLVVTDAPADPRVAHLPPVRAGAVGSYLGMPLTGSGGFTVGALCVFDPAPRTWSDSDVSLLRQLADSVSTELELSALSTEFEASRLRWGLAIDAAEIGSFDWDLQTGRLVWDDRLVELFGYDRGVFGETIEDFNARLHPDDVPRVADALQTAIDTVGPFEAEYRVQLPSGETRWVVGRGRALADGSGRSTRILGAAYDTTRQKHGDARVSRVLESMSAAFYSISRDWRFTYVNAEAERLLQSSREDLLGGEIWELFPATVGSVFETAYRGAMASGEQVVFEAYYPPPLDGWFEIRVWPSPDGLSVYFLEITERRAAENAARTSAARLEMIAEVTAAFGALLAGDRTHEEALHQLARSVVPVLGDAAIVSEADADGRMRDIGSWHVDPDRAAALARYTELRLPHLSPGAPLLRSLDTGEVLVSEQVAELVEEFVAGDDAARAYADLDLRSLVVYPLVARGRTVARCRSTAVPSGPRRTTTTWLPAGRSPTAPRSPWTPPGSTSSSAGSPRSCSAACSPPRRAPPAPGSRCATSRRPRRPRWAGTGTTPSCSPVGSWCWSSATSSATTPRPRRRWASCAGCCAASPTARGSDPPTSSPVWTVRWPACRSTRWAPPPSPGWRASVPPGPPGSPGPTPGTRRSWWSPPTAR